MNTHPPSEGDIFGVARQIQSDEARLQYLNQVCGDDGARRDRVLRLLNEDKRDSFLEKPILATDATLDLEDLVEKEGQAIGPYKLLQQIGEGGFGIVYMAEQQRPVHRKVALKLIKPGMDTKEVIGRFEAERQALAMMDHPNIAKVLDAGTTGSGRPYFVMELVKGIPITDYCDRQQLGTRQRLELFVKVCQAVQHAHQKGVIHRDIKPSNVLVTEHDGTPVPQVIDFGVAKAINQQLTERTLFTRFQQMVGTPMYMSPEQADLSNLDIDTRTDIYSLGVLLYELLTGTTPFDKRRFHEVAYDEIRRLIREEDPPKPSTRVSSLGDTASSVSGHRQTDPKRLSQLMRGDLDWVIMKAMDKDRKRRYETANSFGLDIQRFLENEPVSAAAPSTLYRLRKFTRRNTVAITVTATIAISILIGLGAATYSYFREREARQIAEDRRQEADNARNEADESRGAEEQQRIKAEANEKQARRSQYAADLNFAFAALERHDTAQVLNLLQRYVPSDGEFDWRGWEWRHLWRKTHQNIATIQTHNRPSWGIRSFASSPDGRFLLVAGDDYDKSRTQFHQSLIKLVDAESLQVANTLPPVVTEMVTDLTFFSKGRFLAVDSLGYEPSKTFRGLTVVDFDNEIVAHPMVQLTDSGWPARIAPDGSWAIGTFRGNEIQLMTANNLGELPSEGQALTVIARIHDSLHFRVFNLEGRRIADRSESELAKSEHLDKLKRLLTEYWTEPHPSPPQQEAIHWPVAKALTLQYEKVHRLRCLDFETGKELAKSAPFQTYAWGWNTGEKIRLSRDGRRMAVGCVPDQVLLLSVPDLQTIRSIRVGGGVSSVAWSPDARFLAVGLGFGGGELRDASSGQLVLALKGPSAAPIHRIAFSDDGLLVATAAEDQSIVVWDVENRSIRHVYAHDGYTRAIFFLPDGKRLATGDRMGRVRLWDVSPPEKTDLQDVTHIGHVKYSPDGRFIATNDNGTVSLFDAQSEQFVAKLSPIDRLHDDHQEIPLTRAPLCFSDDGRLLAAGNGDHTAIVYNVVARKPLPFVLRGQSTVRDIAFSPDGRFVVTAHGWDEKVRFWDARTGSPDKTVRARGGRMLHGVQFSPNGQLLAYGDYGVRLWSVNDAIPHLFNVESPSLGDIGQLDNGMIPDTLRKGFEHFGRTLSEKTKFDDISSGKQWQIRDGADTFHVKRLDDALHILAKLWSAPDIGEATAIQFSPDGKQIACGNKRGEVRLYSVPNLELVHTFTGLAGHVNDLSYSPGGTNLLAISRGGIARLFNLKVMSEVGDIVHSSSDKLFSGTFSPDGNSIVVVSLLGGVRQIHAVPQEQLPNVMALDSVAPPISTSNYPNVISGNQRQHHRPICSFPSRDRACLVISTVGDIVRSHPTR